MRSNKFRIFLTVFLVYLFYLAPDYITANTNRFVDLTKSIVDDRTFDIDKYHENTIDRSFYKGHYYIGAAPGLSFMAIPIYMALKPALRALPEAARGDLESSILNLFFALFLVVVPGALVAVLLYEFLRKLGIAEKERILTVMAASFGTILFFYSTRFMAHTMGALMLFGAFYILFSVRKNSGPGYLYFLAGLCMGMAPLLEYPNILGAAAVAVYAMYGFRKTKIKRYLFLILGASFGVALFMYYHYRCFESPFTTAAAYSQMIGTVPIGLPRPDILYGLTFGRTRGLFTFMPILLVSLYGIFVFFRKPDKKYLAEMVLVTAYSLISFLAFAVFCNKFWPTIGEAFGPRHLIAPIPFLMIPLAFAYKKIKYKAVLWITALSFFINWCGVQYGDADSFYIDAGLFALRGLNSNLAEWGYRIAFTYIRQFKVVTHFSPLLGLAALLFAIYLIWRNKNGKDQNNNIMRWFGRTPARGN